MFNNNADKSNLTKDNCPDWDYSSSWYDNDCWTKPEEKKYVNDLI